MSKQRQARPDPSLKRSANGSNFMGPVQTSLRVSTKFWLGAVTPAIGLALVVAAALATGQGKAEAPLLLFFASVVAVPGVLLLNCWVLFVAWSSRIRMLVAACAMPALVGLGALLVVHGTGHWREAGIFIFLIGDKPGLVSQRIN